MSKSSSPRVAKLHYFNAQGRAEFIRLMLHHAGVKFDDVKHSFEEWPALKPTMPFGVMPALEFDNGERISQSSAIGRYVAKKYGFYAGDDAEAQLKIEVATDVMVELFDKFIRSVFEKDQERKDVEMKAFFAEALPKTLRDLNEFAGKHGVKGYFVGKKLSLADFYLHTLYDAAEGKIGQIIEGKDGKEAYKQLKDIRDNVQNDKKLNGYLQGRNK